MTYSDDPEAGVKEWLKGTKLDTSHVAQPDPHEEVAREMLDSGVLDDAIRECIHGHYWKGCYPCSQQIIGAIVPALAALLREREGAAEMRFRESLWLGHGCDALYGDDGEMQCPRCGIDFKRTPIAGPGGIAGRIKERKVAAAERSGAEASNHDARRACIEIMDRYVREGKPHTAGPAAECLEAIRALPLPGDE
jgi:hypothetical protein